MTAIEEAFMKKKTKITLIIGAAVLCVLLAVPAVFFYAGVIQGPHSMVEIYEERWNIDLPDGIQEIYAAKSEKGFTGDGTDYTVYTVENREDAFFSDFSENPDEAFIEDFGEVAARNLKDVPQAQYPDWSKPYQWKRMTQQLDEIFFVWTPDSGTLYILEEKI